VAPDRTANVNLSEGSAAITVDGFSGCNYVADVSPYPFADPAGVGPPGTSPNTTVRVALERRIAGVPGDLGWEVSGTISRFPRPPPGFT
jgi:hypothetical protein